VLQGGMLMMDSTGTDEEIQQNPLFSHYQITVTGERTQSSAKEMFSSPSLNGEEKEETVATKITVVQKAIQSKRPAHSSRKYASDYLVGLGRIILTPVHLENFSNDHSGEIFSQFLQQRLIGNSARGTVVNDPYAYGHQSIYDGLFRVTDLPEISGLLVFFYLLVFFIVITVGERLFLQRMAKLRWTWLVTLGLVIIFCISANRISVATRGTDNRRTTWVIRDIARDGTARDTWYESFIPARNRTSKLTLPVNSVIQVTSRYHY
jgi:hypothetical protein